MSGPVLHLTLFSAGGGSWKAAKVVQAGLRQGDEHRLSFTDVLYEDADAYRFLVEGAANVYGRTAPWVPAAEDFPDYRVGVDEPIEAYAGAPAWRAFLAQLRARAAETVPELDWLVEGRDPWEVFRDERFLGNSSVDPCSKVLKRRLRDRWLKGACSPDATTINVGIGPDERHRFDNGEGGGFGPRMAAQGWRAEAPLVSETAFNAENPIRMMRREGLRPPRLYGRGYAHNNCGGMCCKAGQAHWANRWRTDRVRYDYDAMMERKLIAFLGADVAMLTDRTGGEGKKPLTLDAYAQRLAADPQLDMFFTEPGESGCGCALEAA